MNSLEFVAVLRVSKTLTIKDFDFLFPHESDFLAQKFLIECDQDLTKFLTMLRTDQSQDLLNYLKWKAGVACD